MVAISGMDERQWEPKAAAAGALAFVSKSRSIKCIECILRKLDALLQSPAESPSTADDLALQFRLTSRQQEVLTLIAQGHSNKAIAGFLDITLKIHVNPIFKELRVFNRKQAVLKAQRHSLLQTTPWHAQAKRRAWACRRSQAGEF